MSVTYDNWKYIHFRAITGSNGYGLATAQSDIDTRGWFSPPTEHILSLKSVHNVPQVIEVKQSDTVMWELEHYLHQATKNNPNIIETMWVDDIEFPNPETAPLAEKLIAMREVFLTRNIVKTYGGYATSEWHKGLRMLENGNQSGWKHWMHLCRLLISGAETLRSGQLKVRVDSYRNELLSIRNGQVTRGWLEAYRDELEADFKQAAEVTELPEDTDLDKINAFLLEFRLFMLEQ